MERRRRERFSSSDSDDSSDSDAVTLAQGAFGKVYKQRYGADGEWAAIKKVPIDMVTRKDLKREYKVYRKAAHENIVRILGPITIKDQKYVIPLEFIFGETLETTIFRREPSKVKLTPRVRHNIICGMCQGLEYLHSKDIVHQDLKPDNIMVEHGTNRAVIIDLGLAKFFKNGLNSARDLGNRAYSAPEVRQDECQRDPRSDVWAMGKIIAELRLRRRLRRRLRSDEVRPSKVREILGHSSYCDMVCRMIHPNPRRRATMEWVVSEL